VRGYDDTTDSCCLMSACAVGLTFRAGAQAAAGAVAAAGRRVLFGHSTHGEMLILALVGSFTPTSVSRMAGSQWPRTHQDAGVKGTFLSGPLSLSC